MAMLGHHEPLEGPAAAGHHGGLRLSIVACWSPSVFLVLKLVFWNNFSWELAPLVIGIFFFGSVQLFFIGILGEYIGSIHTQVHHVRRRGKGTHQF